MKDIIMFESDNIKQYFLIFDLAEKESVFNLISKVKLKPLIVFCILDQLLNAVKGIHKLRIAHRDIKNENLLINKKGEVKLSDFDVAMSTLKINNEITSMYLTKQYASPEILLGKECEIDWFAYDIWCIGVLLYELIRGSLPWTDAYETKQVINISVPEFEGYPLSLSTLILECLKPQEDRITLDQIENNEFILKSRKFIRKLEEKNPDLTKSKILIEYINQHIIETGLDVAEDNTYDNFQFKFESPQINQISTTKPKESIDLWPIMKEYISFINS